MGVVRPDKREEATESGRKYRTLRPGTEATGLGRWGSRVLLLEAAGKTAPRRARPTRGQAAGNTSAAELRGMRSSHRDIGARVLPEPLQRLLTGRPSQALGAVSKTNTNGLLSDPSGSPTKRSNCSNSGKPSATPRGRRGKGQWPLASSPAHPWAREPFLLNKGLRASLCFEQHKFHWL